jgi:hypothetical protein
MGSLLPGCWDAEPRGRLLVHHSRTLLTSPSPPRETRQESNLDLPLRRNVRGTRSQPGNTGRSKGFGTARSARVPPRYPYGTAICQWRALHWQMQHAASDVAKAAYAATATPAGT